MKQKELMRNKALYDALEELNQCGCKLNERKKMVSSILANHCNTDEEIYWQIQLFQDTFRLMEQTKFNSKGTKAIYNKIEKTKQFIKTQFEILNSHRNGTKLQQVSDQLERLRMNHNDIKNVNKELKRREKSAQAKASEYEAINAQLKIKLDEHKKSVDNMSAELGRLKRKIQKGRL